MKLLLTSLILVFALGSFAQEHDVRSFATEPNNLSAHRKNHCIEGGTKVVKVTNPKTGRTWMDRNLGAERAATSSSDEKAYGDLYQWGRFSDGHQCRNSKITPTKSTTDRPKNGAFILASDHPYDWRSPQNNELWQRVKGCNNPCPRGFRLPTEAEWEAEYQTWDSNNVEGAFGSPLRLTAAGARDRHSGAISKAGSLGFYWSSTVIELMSTYARDLSFNGSIAGMNSDGRVVGGSIRCIKN